MRFSNTRRAGDQKRAFLHDKRGNVAILFGMLLIPIVMTMGLAIDGLRAFNASETATNALDSAALAAARALAEGNVGDDAVREVAERYFRANVEGPGKVSYATFGGLQVDADRGRNVVTVSVDTVVPTTFAAIFNYEQISMHRTATAVTGLNDIELGLMLDVTGSMLDRGKLGALKRATSDLIESLMPENGHRGRVKIALAPYSASVNTGRYADMLTGGMSRDGCLVERRTGQIHTDAAPARNNLFHVLDRNELRRFTNYECPNAEIQPLSDDRDRLLSAVNRYQARGRTAGHLGISWAWYMVSPRWASVWPGGSQPRPYGTKKLIKAVVLMTDGEFNSAYTGDDSLRAQTRESYSHAQALCDNIKRDDVVVFSVAFDLRDRSAEQALSQCATAREFFFRAENEEELRRAYRSIAVKLTELRLAE